MTDDPYMAAAEAWYTADRTPADRPPSSDLAGRAPFRAAVDAARKPLLDENARLVERVREAERRAAIPPGPCPFVTSGFIGRLSCHLLAGHDGMHRDESGPTWGRTRELSL